MPGQLEHHASNDSTVRSKEFNPRKAKAFCEGLHGTFDPSQTGNVDPELLGAAIRGSSAGGFQNCPQCAQGVHVNPTPVPDFASVDVANFAPYPIADDLHHFDVTVVQVGANNLQARVDLAQGDTAQQAADKVFAQFLAWLQSGNLSDVTQGGTIISATPASDIVLIYDV